MRHAIQRLRSRVELGGDASGRKKLKADNGDRVDRRGKRAISYCLPIQFLSEADQ
jgi:hypothetical protein